jgi:MFS transporter, DHA1 family, multidrug resistance protein
MTICLPSMQDWAGQFGAPQSTVQLTFSGFLLSYGGLQLFFGPLSDRFGRRNILLAGLALALAGSLGAVLAGDIYQLIAARFIQGAGSAAGMVVGRATVQDLFTGPQRTRVMAYIGMVMGCCPPAATILGGQLHVALGWRSNFLVIAALAVVLFALAWNTMPARLAHPNTAQGHWFSALLSSYRRLARETRFVLYVSMLAVTSATFYAFLGGAPVVLRGLGIGPAGVGWYIAVIPIAYIVGNFLTSKFSQSIGQQRLMMLGHLSTVSGISLMLLIALAGVKTALSFSLPLMLVGIGHGLLMPGALANTVGAVPALAGAAAAVAGLMQQLLGGLGGYLGGLKDDQGPVHVGLIMLGFSLLAFLAQWLLNRDYRQS